MNAVQIIPAIDLKEGKCVRLTQGKINQIKHYFDNPVDIALYWQDQGAKRLHLVDLDGAFAGKPQNFKVIEAICKKIKIDIQIGGGIRTEKIINQYLNLGASQIIIGTKAINHPKWFKKILGKYSKQIILGLDAYGTKLALSGWQEKSQQNLFDFACQFDTKHLFAIIYTDISRDGMLGGINWQNTQDLALKTQTQIIASGGLAHLDEIEQLKQSFIKTKGNLFAVIAGKSLYEKTIDFKQALKLLN